jgi:ATP-dependent Lon protease
VVLARSFSEEAAAQSIRLGKTKSFSYDLMEIPLFPLPSLVLFPNIAVPLHIFEDRYKLMINGCIDRAEAFGLVLLRSGATEETEETIHRVGVAAKITDVERLEDGRMNIMCEGELRFRISRFTQQSPFWKGAVQFFEEETPRESLESLYEEVARLYRKVGALGNELTESPQTELVLPESATDLSYMVAYVLDIDSEEKQKMLEMRSTSERLQTLVVHLNETIGNLEKQIALKKVQTKVRGNGDLGKPGREN